MENNFNLFEELYGSYVQLNDRFESVHIWSKEIALNNRGRWIPILITKEKFDHEIHLMENIYLTKIYDLKQTEIRLKSEINMVLSEIKVLEKKLLEIIGN